MKNKNFFYQQYEKINWENQEKTKINFSVNNYIIKNIISEKKGLSVKIFDIGFGIGFFIKMIYHGLNKVYKEMIIESCEPSEKNYSYLTKKPLKVRKGVKLKIYNSTFLNTKTDQKFDFVTAIYVFPYFVQDEISETVRKIISMLESGGKFILVVANEIYLEKKLKFKKDLFLEENIVEFNGNKYKEILHYSEIPKIGKVIDYNREEKFYVDLFESNGLKLIKKENLDDSGFICTIFVFQKS